MANAYQPGPLREYTSEQDTKTARRVAHLLRRENELLRAQVRHLRRWLTGYVSPETVALLEGGYPGVFPGMQRNLDESA